MPGARPAPREGAARAPLRRARSTTGCGSRPLKQALDAFVDESQRVRHRRGAAAPRARATCVVTGRRSPHSLYDYGLATYDAADTLPPRATRAGLRAALGPAASRRWAHPVAGTRQSDRLMGTLWHGTVRGRARPTSCWRSRVSLPFDRRLAADDIAGSRAHVRGLVPRRLARRRRGGRDPGRARHGGGRAGRRARSCSRPPTRTSTPRSSAGSPSSPAPPEAKLHTGRSRNDQVATDAAAVVPSASWTRVAQRVLGLQDTLLDRAGERGRLPTCRATPICSGLSPCCWPTTCWRTAGRSAATSTGCSTPGAGSTCRRSGPARWRARRCRSTPHGTAADLGFDGAVRELARRGERPRLRGRGAVRPRPAGRPPLTHGRGVWCCGRATEFGFVAPRRRATPPAAR